MTLVPFSNGIDDTQNILDTIDKAPIGTTVKFRKDVYKINTEIVVEKDLIIDFNNATIECNSERGITFKGSLKSTHLVANDYIENTSKNSLVLDNVVNVAVGDLVNIVSTELYDTSRLYYYKGGNAIITKIYGNTVYFNLMFPFDMSATSITVNVYNPINISIKNVGLFKGSQDISTSKAGITIEFGVNCSLEKIETDNFQENIAIKRCVNTTLTNIQTGHAKNSIEDSWNGYGIAIRSCTNVRGNNITTDSGQHGLTWGGREVNYGLHFEDSVFKSEVWNLGIGAHTNLWDALFVNVKTFGASLSNNVECRNCDFMPSEISTHDNVMLFPSETPRRANYKFSFCRFYGSNLSLRDYTQVATATNNHVGNIIIEDCDAFRLSLIVANQSGGSKIAEIENVFLSRVTDYVVRVYDKVHTLKIIDSDSTLNTNIISQSDVNSIHQTITNLILTNCTLPQRYDCVVLQDIKNLFIDGLSYNSIDYTNDRITLNGVGNASIKNLDLSKSSRYGLNPTSTFTRLFIENSRIFSSAGGLKTILLNTTRLHGSEITDLRTAYVRDYKTSPSGNKYEVYMGDDGIEVATQLV